jgi:hypothetical protein
MVIVVAATVLALIDNFAPASWFVTSVAAITLIETVLFATWLTSRPDDLSEVIRFSARRVIWIGVLVLVRSVLSGAALILIGLLAVFLGSGASPGLMLYLGVLMVVAVAVLAFVGRLICAGPIVVAHGVSLPGAMRRSWAATAASIAPAGMLAFILYLVSFWLQGALSLLGVVGLVLALVVGAVVAAAVQAGAYRELFAA